MDVPLDSIGQGQVALLGAALARRQPRLVISSPLKRAVETAEAIAGRAGTGTWVDERLIDRHYGRWAGQRVEDIIARWGSIDDAPEVEPVSEVRDRALAALMDIAHNAGGAGAVVVSHDAVNRIALVSLDPSLGPADDLPQDTSCFNTLEYEAQEDGSLRWHVLSVNALIRDEDKASPVRGPATPFTLPLSGDTGQTAADDVR